jgi:hypothetical protein
MEVVSFTPRPLYLQGKNSWCRLNRRLSGLQNRSGRSGEEKNFQPLPRLEPPIIQPVAQRYTTELSRLFYVPNISNNSELLEEILLSGNQYTHTHTHTKREEIEKE